MTRTRRTSDPAYARPRPEPPALGSAPGSAPDPAPDPAQDPAQGPARGAIREPSRESGNTVRIPAPRGRPPRGLPSVERILKQVLDDPDIAAAAASSLRFLTRPGVRKEVERSWIHPDYEPLWRSLASHAAPPVRRHCLEFAAACRWSAR